MKIIGVVLSHFDAYHRRTKFDFFWRITLEGLVLPLILARLVSWIVPVPHRTAFAGMPWWKLFAEIVILAPFFETLLLQSFPVMIARACQRGFWGQVAATLVPFAALHFVENWGVGVFAGMLGGFYLAFTYVRWRQVSYRAAFWMTAGSHAVHNLAVVLLALAAGGLK
jgi:hypothetical protein